MPVRLIFSATLQQEAALRGAIAWYVTPEDASHLVLRDMDAVKCPALCVDFQCYKCGVSSRCACGLSTPGTREVRLIRTFLFLRTRMCAAKRGLHIGSSGT